MNTPRTRREFLAEVGRGMLVTTVGFEVASGLGLSPALAAEVPERLGPHATDAGVAILRVDDLALALVLDVRELELLAEDVGKLFQGDVDLEAVLTGALAGLLAALALLALLAAHRIAGVAVALAGAALLLVAEAEARDIDLRNRDGDEVLALAPDQLALRDVLAKVLPDLAANDRAEPRVILIDLQGHRTCSEGYQT